MFIIIITSIAIITRPWHLYVTEINDIPKQFIHFSFHLLLPQQLPFLYFCFMNLYFLLLLQVYVCLWWFPSRKTKIIIYTSYVCTIYTNMTKQNRRIRNKTATKWKNSSLILISHQKRSSWVKKKLKQPFIYDKRIAGYSVLICMYVCEYKFHYFLFNFVTNK